MQVRLLSDPENAGELQSHQAAVAAELAPQQFAVRANHANPARSALLVFGLPAAFPIQCASSPLHWRQQHLAAHEHEPWKLLRCCYTVVSCELERICLTPRRALLIPTAHASRRSYSSLLPLLVVPLSILARAETGERLA